MPFSLLAVTSIFWPSDSFCLGMWEGEGKDAILINGWVAMSTTTFHWDCHCETNILNKLGVHAEKLYFNSSSLSCSAEVWRWSSWHDPISMQRRSPIQQSSEEQKQHKYCGDCSHVSLFSRAAGAYFFSSSALFLVFHARFYFVHHKIMFLWWQGLEKIRKKKIFVHRYLYKR